MLQKETQANQAKGDVEGVGPWGRLPWLVTSLRGL